MPVEKRFFFHANAVALGMHIRRDEEFLVPAVASSCLPATGGIGTAEAAGKDFRGIVAYDSASSSVFGDYSNRKQAVEFTSGNHGDNNLPTVTTVDAKLNGLFVKIGDRVFRAGTLEASMENVSDRKTAPEFHALTAAFDRVSVDGVPLRISTHCDIFATNDTKAKLEAAYSTDEKFRKSHGAHFFSTGDEPSRAWWRRPKLPQSNGLIYGTIVTDVSWEGQPPRDTTIQGNRVTIRDFGSIYLGEILIQEGMRRVTLIRFQLGSRTGGDGTGVDIQSNGTGWPPERGSET